MLVQAQHQIDAAWSKGRTPSSSHICRARARGILGRGEDRGERNWHKKVLGLEQPVKKLNMEFLQFEPAN